MILKNGLIAVWITRVLLGFSICIFLIAVFSFSWKGPVDGDMLKKQRTLALRSIGHKLLLNNSDSTTVIPPISYLNENTLRLTFYKPISISPDSLSAYSIHHLNTDLVDHFIVTVTEPVSKETAYGFEMNYHHPNDIPCVGRMLPYSNYWIDVTFYDQKIIGLNNDHLVALGSISFLGFLSLTLFRRKFSTGDKIGFNFEDNNITIDNQNLQLTEKEIQILFILNKNNGNLVSRNYLVDEVWSKEGIVTDRSLDVYISRLRKKLLQVSKIEIQNRHGKGYMLKTG